MTDFATRRAIMVDSQIRPNDITKFPVIEALLHVPREEFVPEAWREAAYVSENIPLAPGRVLFDLASMLILAAVISLIAVKCWPVLEKSLTNASRANTPLETPLWWVQLPWLAGWVWFAVMSWLVFLAALAMVARRDWQAAEGAIGTMGELAEAEANR